MRVEEIQPRRDSTGRVGLACLAGAILVMVILITHVAHANSRVSETVVYGGSHAVALRLSDLSDGGYVAFSHALPATANVRAHSWIYDSANGSSAAIETDASSPGGYSRRAIPPASVYNDAYGLQFDGELVSPTYVFLPSIAARSRPQVPILGVALERYDEESGLEEALGLGTHWLRRWQHISWRDVEPNEGEYHWEELVGLEQELLRLRERGAESLLVIQMTPQWAQAVEPYACGPIRADKFDAFAAFMEELVTRYGPSTPYGVRYWQLGNELDVAPGEVGPNAVFGCWGDPSDPYFGGEHYGEMLKTVYPRMKLADPDAQVMMGGLLLECDPYTVTVGYECSEELRGYFLEGVLLADGGDYFDAIDVHSYAQMRPDLPSRMHSYYGWSGEHGGTGLPEKVAFVRQVLEAYGYDNMPVFAGELALKCEAPTAECYDVGAALVPRAYAEAYGLDLLGGMYYALILEFNYKGLLLPDLTPRPAYWAYQFLSRELINRQYVGPVTDYGGVTGYAFGGGRSRRVEILWSTDGTDQEIDVPADLVSAYDKFGAEIAPAGGHLTIGWSPVYLELE